MLLPGVTPFLGERRDPLLDEVVLRLLSIKFDETFPLVDKGSWLALFSRIGCSVPSKVKYT